MIGHVTPEAATGGPLALVEDGDLIVIDAKNKNLALSVSDEVLAARRTKWVPIDKTGNPKGVLAKYAKLVRSAHHGATTS